MTRSYIRSDDGEGMVEVKPGHFVARKVAERLGLPIMVAPVLERAPAPPRGAGRSAHKNGPRPAASRAVAGHKKEPVPA